jgi:hypothetical protein
MWEAILTLNSMAQIHTSVTLLTSRDLAWNSGRLTCQHAYSNFCCRTHFVRRDVRVERSSDVTGCFPKWREMLIGKVRQRTFLYDTKSPRLQRSAYENQCMGRDREGVENKTWVLCELTWHEYCLLTHSRKKEISPGNMDMYALFCILFANWHSPATLTEVFPCFFLSCKANARVYLAKTGHSPHSS